MQLQNTYLREIYQHLVLLYSHEKEFLQSVMEVLASLDLVIDHHPEWIRYNVVGRMVEPERFVLFRIPWVDDQGNVQVNRGYRVQYNSALGPYKGGLRFHPTVNASIIKFLGFEQTIKNGLTTLPLGGGKGGSDFNPKGKSNQEIMRFCHSFMNELYRHLGEDTDVPAGDIGVGAREIGFLYGQYRKITNKFTGVFTGKGLSYGGSLIRKEATGYGLCYFAAKALEVMKKDSFVGKKVSVSGSGNVAIYTAEKAMELGATVVAMSDSKGVIVDENGIDVEVVKDIKEANYGALSEYNKRVPSATYLEGATNIWKVPCHIALPCATQNELDIEDAKMLVKNGVILVMEGANMPCTNDAIHYFKTEGVIYAPGKASNAGGVLVSGLEMSQNSMRYSWSKEEVDQKLKEIMEQIFYASYETAKKYEKDNDLDFGANIAGFKKVAEAMIAQGVI